MVWLDAVAARARYGMWIDGVLPELVPWEKVFHARGAAAQRRRQQQQQQEGDKDGAVSALCCAVPVWKICTLLLPCCLEGLQLA